MIHGFASAFGLTILIEGVVAAAVLRKFFWLETALIQCVTWPVMAVLVLHLHHVIVIEIGVVVVETWLWMLVLPIGLRKAAAVSFLANGVTASLGLFLY